jgi:hypothetical protein
MASVTLVHPEETLTTSALQAMAKCSLFQKNPALLVAPYRVQSSVTLLIFQEFISALERKTVKITDTNFTGLQRLCEEFGFGEFAAKLSEFRASMGFKGAEDAGAGGRIAALEEKAQRHDRAIALLQDKFTQLSRDFGRLAGEVSALRSASAGIAGMPPAAEPSPQKPPAPSFDSRVISGFPEIFAEFRGKRFEILWRGSRDGFKAKEFHRRCEGHANTLTVILDTKGNIFGGFTPVEWESRPSSYWKADDSLKSFLFTLKNPHNIPAMRFALKPEKRAAQSIVIPEGVHTLMTLLFSITAMQTPTVQFGFTPLTSTTPDCVIPQFSPVRKGSKSKKSKSLRSQTEQLFPQSLLAYTSGIAEMEKSRKSHHDNSRIRFHNLHFLLEKRWHVLQSGK